MNIHKIKNNIKSFAESKNFKKLIYAIGIVFSIFLIFQLGMIAGFRKASFRNDWGNNYERNFGSMRKAPFFMGDNLKDLPNAHGAIGKIIKIEFPNIVVLDKDQIEKVVVIKDDTNILERRDKITENSLAIDQFIIVIGNPNNQGQIEAKLIRIIPSPEEINLNMSGFNNNI